MGTPEHTVVAQQVQVATASSSFNNFFMFNTGNPPICFLRYAIYIILDIDYMN